MFQCVQPRLGDRSAPHTTSPAHRHQPTISQRPRRPTRTDLGRTTQIVAGTYPLQHGLLPRIQPASPAHASHHLTASPANTARDTQPEGSSDARPTARRPRCPCAPKSKTSQHRTETSIMPKRTGRREHHQSRGRSPSPSPMNCPNSPHASRERYLQSFSRSPHALAMPAVRSLAGRRELSHRAVRSC